MAKVYLLQHTNVIRENEDVKIIGIFSSRESVFEAINKLKVKNGFKENIDNFTIDEYELDMIFWKDGFDTQE